MARKLSSWYALCVTSRQEAFVVRAIDELRIALDVLAYAPVHVTEARFAKRKASRSKPLIPGYVFAHLPDDDCIHAALSIRGVHGLLLNGGKPLRIRPLDIGAMVLEDACHAYDETWVPPKPKGKRYTYRWNASDRVSIYKGPFAGFSGLVLRTKNRGRMDVLVTLFGRALEIEIEERQLTTPDGLADKLAA